jgi:hypothetical protein
MRRTEVWIGIALLLLFLLGLARARGESAPKLDAMPQTPELTAQMLERSSTVVLKVPDYDTARRQVLAAAAGQGAEILDAKTQVDEKGKKHGWVSLRVGAGRLPDLLPALQSVGKLYSDAIQTLDNISEYEELARRIGRLQQHEARLSGILQSPRRMRGSDILFLQDRLFRAGVDESTLAQQRLDLERSALASTVRVELFEPGGMPFTQTPGQIDLARWFADAKALARADVNRQMARGATAAAYLLVYAPFWVPALVIGLLLLRWLWIRRFRLAAFALRLASSSVAWLRIAWDARHRPIGVSQSTQ